MVFARLYMFLFLTHFRPTCSRIYTFAILYSTAKVAKVYSTRTKVGLHYSIQLYVIKFGNDLRQVSGFLLILRFPPPLKLCFYLTGEQTSHLLH